MFNLSFMCSAYYALHMKEKLKIQAEEDVRLEKFEVDVVGTAKLIEKAIGLMDRNKAVGEDNLHVEMMKKYASKIAQTLIKCWREVGRTKIIPDAWTSGSIVPLFKGKGEMGTPQNYKPLCILSHARKVVEKGIVAQIE